MPNDKQRKQNALRQSRFQEKQADLTIPPYNVSARRKKCEHNLQLFCETYLKQRFPLPSSDDQREAIEKIQHATLTGGQFAQSAPRGDGKTQRAIAGALWAALYGHRRYIVTISATADKGKGLVRELEQELADNDALYKDWPEICRPIRRAFAKPNASRFITVNGQEARVNCGTNKLVFPCVEVCKNAPRSIAGVIVEGAGVSAAFRGLRHMTANGETLRPELAILDDVQTRKSAMSVGQTERVMQILRGDIKRLAGPDKELAVVCNCTVVRRGDAADQLLDNKANPQWRGVRKKMVYEWPKATALWKNYTDKRRAGLLDGDGGAAANSYYVANRAEMDSGGVVGWSHRFRRDIGELSAIQCAYNILIDDGEEAFQAECQNEPLEKSYTVVDLKPDIVMTRLNGLAPGIAPTLARTANIFIDPNKGWLAWSACAWQADMTGFVMGYGTWPEQAERWDDKKTHAESLPVFMANKLIELVPTLLKQAAFSRTIDRVAVDIGWGDLQDTMLAAIVHLRDALGFKQVVPARGSPAFRFKPDVERYEFAQFQPWEKKGEVLVANTNWHKMKVQSAFAQNAGTPGSLTLFGDSNVRHREFAMSICAEKLEDYKPGVRDGDAGMFKWVRVPAQRNEMLDCVTGCRVLACWWKVTTGAIMPSTATVTAPTPVEAQAASASAQPVPQQEISYAESFGGGEW